MQFKVAADNFRVSRLTFVWKTNAAFIHQPHANTKLEKKHRQHICSLVNLVLVSLFVTGYPLMRHLHVCADKVIFEHSTVSEQIKRLCSQWAIWRTLVFLIILWVESCFEFEIHYDTWNIWTNSAATFFFKGATVFSSNIVMTTMT